VFTLFLLGSGIMWEVFDPRVGTAVFTTRFEWVARLVARCRGLDFDRVGEGWV